MISPYQQPGNTNWNIPNLYEALRDWRARQDKATQQISEGMIKMGQAVAGGIQGAKNPGTFGKDTSPVAAGVMGAFMNTAGGSGTAGTSNIASDGWSSGQTSVDAPTFANANNSGLAGLINPNNGMSRGDDNPFLKMVKNAKIADQFVKANPEVLQTMGIPLEQFQAASAQERMAVAPTYFATLAVKDHVSRQAEQQVRLQKAQAEAAANDRYNAAAANLTRPVNVWDNGMMAGGVVQDPALTNFANMAANPAPLNGAEMQRLAVAGGMSLGQQDQLAQTAERWALAQKAQRDLRAGNNLGFQEDPVSGVRFATFGNILQPSGVNPDKTKPSTTMVDDGQGGYIPVLVNPKTGGGTQLRTGEVSDVDQFKALHADKIALMAARSKVAWNKQVSAQYDVAIAKVDERLNQLTKEQFKETPAPAGSANSRYKIVEVK